MEQINLNIIPDGVMPVCHASQFDKNRTIRFNLKDNGSVYTLAGTETITCKVRKPDDTESTINVANTSSSYVDVTFGFSDTDLSGYAMCELKIVKGTQTIGSRNILLNIEADAFDGSKFEERSASGAIASFETNYIDNLNELIVNITATQAGSGTPSNPRAISGWSSCDVVTTPDSEWAELWDIDNTFGGVVNFNQLSPIYDKSAEGGTAFTVGTTIVSGHKYFVSRKLGTNSNVTVGVFTKVSGTTSQCFSIGGTLTETIVNSLNGGASLGTTTQTDGNIWLYQNAAIRVYNLQIVDLTDMFGSTIADYIYSLEQNEAGAGVSFFRNLYPNDYYDYDAGTSELVGGDDKVVTTISLGDTYYGGTLNVTTGELTITYWYIDMGTLTWSKVAGYPEFRANYSANNIPNGKNQPENVKSNLICSIYPAMSTSETYRGTNTGVSLTNLYISVGDDRYSDETAFTNAMSGVQLVYELATPTTVQLTPTEVRSLLNCNIFADTGDVVSCKYLVEVT